jgi:hypothetical protein
VYSTILRGIETLVVAMNSCEVKCEYMTLYGQGRASPASRTTSSSSHQPSAYYISQPA